MEFCAIICEFNPLHNGHKYLLDACRAHTGQKILCLMSGNFTQRGEAAAFEKYDRARHAVLCGADIVAELPAAFACAPAELFAQGAVRILSALPAVKTLAFGCERGGKEDFLRTAEICLHEDRAFKADLKLRMRDGTSYLRARNAALIERGADGDMLSSPNNILGVEYCRAILTENCDMVPLPVLRLGADHADGTLHKNFSSATAIRAALGEGGRKAARALHTNTPACVYADREKFRRTVFKQAAMCALLSASPEQIAACADCSEGLENRLLSLSASNPDYDALLSKAVSKRYTAARIRRVLAQNFLGLTRKQTRTWLGETLYLNVLAVRKEGAEEILSSLTGLPLLVRKSDASLLKKGAAECFARDRHAVDLYNALSGICQNPYLTLFV